MVALRAAVDYADWLDVGIIRNKELSENGSQTMRRKRNAYF